MNNTGEVKATDPDTGGAKAPRPFTKPAEVFELAKRKVLAYSLEDPLTECWDWQRATSTGYGVVCFGKELWKAHRVAYEVFIGPIPSGYQIDHLCRNRACVNPDHLEPVTNRENARRSPIMGRKRSANCMYGHSLEDQSNIYLDPRGKRRCRECRRIERRRRRAEGKP